MLGKTHVVGSLAIAHAGLLGYTVYQNRDSITSTDVAPRSVLGLAIGEPLSLVSYSVIVTTVLLFVLLLLRVGKGKLLTGYFGLMLLLLVGLKVLFDSTYPFELAVLLLVFALGSLLPDIDSENSTIGKYIKPISRAIPHRTITHTIWVVALLIGLSWYLGSVYLLVLALGYTIHITEDAFSKQGICWFYPIIGSYDTFSGGGVKKHGRTTDFAYKTGGTGEELLFYGFVLIHVLCVGFFIFFMK